jgi:hypothetical protein
LAASASFAPGTKTATASLTAGAGVKYQIKVLCSLSSGETKGFLLPLNRLNY